MDASRQGWGALMRCDLHVHSSYSGAVDLPLLRHVGRESYSDPAQIYERAKSRGMDLVTISDHDTIEGALRLAHLPDTFVSEEVTVRLPGGRKLHVNVFDIGEREHQAIQARAGDPEALFAWLAENRVPACVNHLFSALTGPRDLEDLLLPLGRLGLIEGLNGAMPRGHNEAAVRVGREAAMSRVGGSDAHSLRHVASAFTTVPGARDRREFLDGLRRGLTIPAGRSGSYARMTSEVVRVFASSYAAAGQDLVSGTASPVGLLGSLSLVPFLPLIPLVTLAIFLHEVRFAARFARAFQQNRRPTRRPSASLTLGEAA